MTIITNFPDPPNRQTDDAATFSVKSDLFVSSFPLFVAQANAVASETNTALSGAMASEMGANAVAGVTKWTSGTTYQNGQAVYSASNYLTYRRITAAGSGTTDPSADPTNWAQVVGTGNVSTTGTQTLLAKTLNSPVITGELTSTSTSSFRIPVGTTAQRPTGQNGKIRYNTTTSQYEGFAGSIWTSIGGGATGGGADQVFVQNGRIVTTAYTIPSGKNASTVGPITFNAPVTVSTGSRLVIL